ncbi:sigma-70 family RNA polymerase sigma factor [Runella sp.]|jgi:RNA polymerase sigma factor (sigma-70 family)|uniref:sigma-70 family RNA polymerase sigma factor n=1 Tax=Runella sp. TaxID=1960881 RepID=UPI002609DA01|nr:sigma-70 family RNA polymerase sigma factor [Runella sp.]
MWLFNRTLEVLLGKIPQKNNAALKNAVADLFKENIGEKIRKTSLPAAVSHQDLFQATLTELTNIIDSNRTQWPKWYESTINEWMGGLVMACRWKLHLLTWNTEESRENSFFLTHGLLFYIENQPPTHQRKLVEKLDKSNKEAIAMRVLRAMLPFLKTHTNLTFFQLIPSHGITLQKSLVNDYLSEQIPLYVYMFIDDCEGNFLKEIQSYLKHYVQKGLKNSFIPSYEEMAKDVVQDAIKIFIEKRSYYRQHPDEFYVDKRLGFYFIDLMRRYKLLSTYFKKHNKTDFIDEKMEDEILSNNINDNEYGGLSHENEEISIIVKGCFNTLEEKCQELLKTRYLLDFSQALSHQDIKSRTGVSVRTIERSMPKCEEILRTCIVYKASQQGLRLF